VLMNQVAVKRTKQGHPQLPREHIYKTRYQ
jgi:hypothetical protein